MTCKKCRKEFDDQFAFCPFCGEKKQTENVCNKCGFVVSSEFSFCPKCGGQVCVQQPLLQYQQSAQYYQPQPRPIKKRSGEGFYALEKRTNILKNSVMLLVAVILSICSFFGGFAIDGSDMGFKGIHISQSQIQLLDAAFGEKLSSSEIMKDMQTQIASNVSSATLRKFASEGAAGLNSAEKAELSNALSGINMLKIAFCDEVAESSPTTQAMGYILAVLVILSIFLPIPFIVLLIYSICKKKHFKAAWLLGLIGFAMMLATFLFATYFFGMSTGNIIGAGYISFTIFAVLIIVIEIVTLVLYTKSLRVSSRTIIKRSVLAALSIVLMSTAFLGMNSIEYKKAGSSSSGTASIEVNAQISSVNYLTIGDLLTLGNFQKGEVFMDQLDSLLSSAPSRSLKEALLQSSIATLLTNNDMESQYGAVLVFVTIIPFIQGGIYGLMAALLVLLLYRTITGKEEKKTNMLYAFVSLVLAAVSLVAAIVLPATFNESLAYQKITNVTLYVGAGVIANFILLLGFLIVASVFSEKATVQGGGILLQQNQMQYSPDPVNGQNEVVQAQSQGIYSHQDAVPQQQTMENNVPTSTIEEEKSQADSSQTEE